MKRYWLGPWQYSEVGGDRPPGWNAPAGTFSVIDLRHLGDQSTTVLGERPYGFFAGPDDLALDSDYTLLGVGDCREIATTAAMQDAWQAHTGYRPKGERLVDLLWDQLTDGSDIDAESSCGPLVPRADGTVELLLAGHSVVKREIFADRLRRGGRWANILTGQLRRQFARQFRANSARAEKVLGNWQAKYRLGADWKHVVPPFLRSETQGPRVPETTYSDNFNRALLGALWLFRTGFPYSIYTSTGIGRPSGGFQQAEYDGDLSSDDHRSKVTWTPSPSGRNFGPVVRSENPTTSTPSFYYSQRFGSDFYASKVVAGVQSNIVNATATSTSAGDIDEMEADGSDIVGRVNGTDNVSVTDTSLSGSLRSGLMVITYGGDAFTAWETSDVAAGPGTFTGTAAITVGGTTIAASATHTPPTYSASAVLSAGGAEFASAVSSTDPVYAATADLTAGPTDLAATATVAAPVYTAAASISIGAPDLAATATFVAPVYTASLAAEIGGAEIASAASSTDPVYAATADLTAGPTDLAATATFVAPVYTASAAVSIGAPDLVAAAAFQSPVYTASLAADIGGAQIASAATSTEPTYTATADLTAGPTDLAASATFAAPTYTASSAVSIGAPDLVAEAAFQAPVYTANLAAAIAGAEIASAATSSEPTYAATAGLTSGPVDLDATATFVAAVYTASAAGSIGGVDLDASAMVDFEVSVGSIDVTSAGMILVASGTISEPSDVGRAVTMWTIEGPSSISLVVVGCWSGQLQADGPTDTRQVVEGPASGSVTIEGPNGSA